MCGSTFGIPDQPACTSPASTAATISTPRHSASIPEVPTAAEQGFPGFDIATVIGLQARAGTPPEVIARLNTEINKVLNEPATRQKLLDAGANVVPQSIPEFAAFVQAEREKYERVIKLTGVKAD